MPKTKRSNASGSSIVNVAAMEKINKDTLALSVLELLKDTAIVAELKETLFPIELKNSITNLTATVASLTNELDRREKRIVDLEKRVDFLEKTADDVEQYSRRPNLRFHGFAEARKVTDCWTTGGNVMIKELNNKIRQVKSESDLKNY